MSNQTAEQRAARKAVDRAIRAAGNKLPFRSEKARNEMLEHAAHDMAQAYQIGAEEAQGEIISRLRQLRKAFEPKPVESPSFSPNFDERNGIR